MPEAENDNASIHKSVLLREVIEILSIEPGDIVLDGTLGGGGHAREILSLLGPEGRYIGIDADRAALRRAEALFEDESRFCPVLGNYRDMDTHLESLGIAQVDKILLDIGLSSDQLENKSNRGFSFQSEEPLKMTFCEEPQEGTLTAWHVVNEWSESSLADIIFGFGGEKKARKIARAITEAREEKQINTSKRLADIIASAVFSKGPTHPATKTFQAVRMAVNDELGALEEGLTKSQTLLSKNGRIAVISFHSLEDRIVKQTFRAWEDEGKGVRITKRPLTPSREEYLENRRARSAKLRAFHKTV